MTSSPAKFSFSWTGRDLIAIAATCVIALAVLIGRATAGGASIGEHIPVYHDRLALAQERINPNTASMDSLQRLPGIKGARAAAICGYRLSHPGQCFRTAADLEKVPGIGPGTSARLGPYVDCSARAD